LASAQLPPEDKKPGYLVKEIVHLVVVPVSVRDRHGDLVEDLSQQDFRVFEDGEERPIKFFSNDPMPLAAVVLLDTGMSSAALAEVREAAASLADAFTPDDEEALYLFDNNIRLVQDFSAHAEQLPELARKALPEGPGPLLIGGPLASPTQINGVPMGGPTGAPFPSPAPSVGKRLRDALFTAAQRLKTQPPSRRRVVVIVSDGVNGSDNEFSYHQALEALESSNVTVFAISFGGGWALKRADLLSRVARETGGDIAYVQRRIALEQSVIGLTNEARNPYVLGFPPASADGKLHEIRVRVTRRGVRLAARSHFLAIPAK